MEYIRKRNNYFMTESGQPWTPVGYNECYTWPSLNSDINSYFANLNAKGINCLRLMFENYQTKENTLETQMDVYNQQTVDKLKHVFSLCETYNIRLLVSPYDTFWQWKNWNIHAYNKSNGGYLDKPNEMLAHADTISVHKQRFRFLIENFANSGVIFGWDLWNEMHPAYDNETDAHMNDYISEIGKFVRDTEMELFGKSHLQTCSVFVPALITYSKLNLLDTFFRHKQLDFCNVHLYDDATISNPKNTIDAAVKVGNYLKDCIAQIKDGRPIFDSEHGPILAYEKTGTSLDEEFDNEYFSNISWAHLASGGVSAGMRWPYRNPHILTDGMLNTLSSINSFCSLVDWNKFNRTCYNGTVLYNNQNNVKVFCCGTGSKFIMYVLRTNPLDKQGKFDKFQKKRTAPIEVKISIPNVTYGEYKVISWKEDTQQSTLVTQVAERTKTSVNFTFLANVNRNLILYIEKI